MYIIILLCDTDKKLIQIIARHENFNNCLPEAVAPVDGIVLKQLFLITDFRLSFHFPLLGVQFNHLYNNNYNFTCVKL